MTACDRGGRSAPCVEFGRQALAVLIPPQRVVRSAQPTQIPCLPVANRNPAYTKSWEWLGCRMVHKLRSRQVQPFPVIIVTWHSMMLLFRHGRGQSRTAQITSPRRSWRTGPAVANSSTDIPESWYAFRQVTQNPSVGPASLRHPEHGNTGTPRAGDLVVVPSVSVSGLHPAVVRNSASSRDQGSSVARLRSRVADRCQQPRSPAVAARRRACSDAIDGIAHSLRGRMQVDLCRAGPRVAEQFLGLVQRSSRIRHVRGDPCRS